MKIAVTFPPLPVPRSASEVGRWAREAEDREVFSTLGAIEGVKCSYLDPITVLTIGAHATSSIPLMTSVLVAPLPPEHPPADQTARHPRPALGRAPHRRPGVGNRKDEFGASGVPYQRRGKLLDEWIATLGQSWSVDAPDRLIGPGPTTPDGPALVFAGMAEASFRRAARHGTGWIAPPGSAALFRSRSTRRDEAWSEAGRSGSPCRMALVYHSLGDDADASCSAFFDDLFSRAPPVASMLASGTPKGPGQLAERLEQLAELGCDEAV